MYKSLPNRLRFPSYYCVQFEPPDDSGEEGLVFASDQRRIRLKGRSLREVQQRLIPLLDGSRSIESICSAVADVFEPEDVNKFLQLLRTHRLLDDALEDQLSPELQRRFAPQLHFLRELAVDAQEAQMRVASRSVAVVGLSRLLKK